MKRSKTRLFFLEMAISLIFFLLCAGVCLTLFGRAADMSRASRDLNGALVVAESAAETVRALGGDCVAAAELLELEARDGRYFARYDNDWLRLDAGESSVYRLELTPGPGEDGIARAAVAVLRCDGETAQEIFSIDVSVFTGEVA